LIRSPFSTVLFNAPPGSSFRFVWEGISVAVANASLLQTNKTGSEGSMPEFDCGGTLVATYKPQYLTNPGATDADGKFTTIPPQTTTLEPWRTLHMYRLLRWHGGYADNLKCRWTIVRPMFTGLLLKIISMDLEEHVDCRFDYVAISSDANFVTYEDGQLTGDIAKYCKHKDVGSREVFNSDEVVSVYFMTDRNRAGQGFVIEYRLVCQSFHYIQTSMGVFDQVLHSPNYPDQYDNNLTCSWSILLESSRSILAKFVSMDIEQSEGCTKDSISVVSA
uniref:CUB domain-containing protein n=1 Tax=Gongylonema pulchrum TaxID=637853 RepID=A0A183D0Y3_9BILA